MKNKIQKFAKYIHPVYVLLKWTWGRNNGFSVPTVLDIEETLNHLVSDLKKSPKSVRISTGGLFAERDENNLIEVGFECSEYIN